MQRISWTTDPLARGTLSGEVEGEVHASVSCLANSDQLFGLTCSGKGRNHRVSSSRVSTKGCRGTKMSASVLRRRLRKKAASSPGGPGARRQRKRESEPIYYEIWCWLGMHTGLGELAVRLKARREAGR